MKAFRGEKNVGRKTVRMKTIGSKVWEINFWKRTIELLTTSPLRFYLKIFGVKTMREKTFFDEKYEGGETMTVKTLRG